MKDNKTLLYIFLISIQFLFNFQIINSFGIKDVDPHLLIYFLQENKKTNTEMLSEENFMKVLTLGNFLSLHNYQAIFLNADYNLQVTRNFALGVGGNFEYSRIAVPKEKPLYYLNGSFNTKATVTF